ncbi:aminoglycoside phosphotransferase [Nocardia transvalensis]|uniref:aminoglycoside phosphotransferase n=1 Tax=Nocardia transvalensis TaxID=37333 RepID=UPI00189438C5|nr:aminoglycoside phosphotransferase [Nocardia transvalensis]MBF6327803.1 aminoglycoside phosphotransferase [Nocardia transvalensis]
MTGPIVRAESVVAGFSSHLAAVVDTADDRTFVKGMRADDPEVWTQHREATLGPYVTPIGPQVRWQIATDGWDLLGFEYVAGHFADYRIESDLVATAAAMAALGRLRCPANLELKDAEKRWGTYLSDPADRERLAGDALLHTDWNYSNVLITEAGVARLVDWPWATRGAAWIDPGCWIVWLILAGQRPEEAETWAARVPAWHTATDHDLALFSTALAEEWTATATRNSNVWTRSLRDAAHQWKNHRLHL